MRTKKHLVKNIVTFVMAIALVIGMIPVMPGEVMAKATEPETEQVGHTYTLSDLDYGIELEVGDTVKSDENFEIKYGNEDSHTGDYCNSFTITNNGLEYINNVNTKIQYPDGSTENLSNRKNKKND